MSAEEFWKDDPQLFVSYRTSFVNKKKRELEETDYKCWLNGLYTHDGNGKLFSSLKQFMGNMLSKSKDRKQIDTYPSKPYTELERDKEKQEVNDKKKQKYEDFQQSLNYFGTMKQRYLESLKKKSMKGE